MKNNIPDKRELDAQLVHCLGRCKHLKLQQNTDNSVSYFCQIICELQFKGVSWSEYVHGHQIKISEVK